MALLELLAAAARAGIVAADLRRRAPHRVDLVAQGQRQLVQLGDAGDDLADRVLERLERQLARDQCRRALLVVGKEAEQPRQGERDLRVFELIEPRQEVNRLLEAGDPGQDRAADRIVRRGDRDVAARVGIRRGARVRLGGGGGISLSVGVVVAISVGVGVVSLVARLEDERIEAAVFGDRAIERSVPAQDQRARALLLGRRLGLAPAMAAGVEDVGQPRVGIEQGRLDDDAAQKAVEHDDVERLERLGDGGEQLVELGELGVAQVLLAGGDRAARRRRRFRQAHRRGGVGSLSRPAARRGACAPRAARPGGDR